MNAEKKTRELSFLHEIETIYVDFPVGIIKNYESPDFLIQQESQVLGIEIVDYVRGQSEGESVDRRNESLWQRVADTARKEFEATHSVPLLVHFFWYPHRHPRQADVRRLATSAVSVISKHIPEEVFTTTRVVNNNMKNTPLEEFLDSITILRVRNDEQSLWSFIDVGFIEVQVEEIQRLISAKSEKINDYKRHCNIAWLVIVAEGRHISSSVSLTEEVLSYSYKSQFSRVLFYDRFTQRVFQLVTH